MSEHTDGPWRVGGTKQIPMTTCREIASDNGRIGLVYGVVDEENKANAMLIAAAPELLAACKEARYQLQVMDSACAIILNDAIKKAEGDGMSEHTDGTWRKGGDECR